MRRKAVLALLLAGILVCGLAAQASADELATAGRQIAAKWSKSVVTVQLVLKVTETWEGETSEQELKVDATGTVIDPSGLVVAALSATIPTEARNKAEGDEGGDSSTEVKDTKIITADGQEIPATVIIRDRELDLVFIKPTEKPAKPFDAVDLAKAGKVQLMDEMVCLYRLGLVASRSLAACSDRVQAVVEKPRMFCAPGLSMMAASLGAPVFAMDGSPIGLMLLRTLPGGSDIVQVSGIGARGSMYIVLPASDVLEAAKQAKE